MARFGERCFAKQRNNIIISRNSEKISCFIEGPGSHGGDRELQRGKRAIEGVESRRGVEAAEE
jgi:hypothetical protein